MDAKELAQLLTGNEYGSEISRDLERKAKEAGLVVVFGGSDDLIEFCGAIHDEFGARNDPIKLDAKGVAPNFDDLCDDKDRAGLQDYFLREAGLKQIEALWCREEPYSWTHKTDIPHETFEIVEDGEPFCRGIVFRLADLDA